MLQRDLCQRPDRTTRVWVRLREIGQKTKRRNVLYLGLPSVQRHGSGSASIERLRLLHPLSIARLSMPTDSSTGSMT